MRCKTLQTEVPMPPEVRRRRMRASKGMLFVQEAAAQVKNDVYSTLRLAHEDHKTLPSLKEVRQQLKEAPSGFALGRAKQVQYAIDDAFAMFRSFRSNFFAWAKDPTTRLGKPQPPRFYRRGQRARVRADYQDFKVQENRLYLPASFGLDVLALVERNGEPILGAGDRLVEVDVNGCIGLGRKAGGKQWLDDFIGRLGSSPGTKLVPRKLHVNGRNIPVQSPGVRTPPSRGLSSRTWISTKVALVKAGLISDLQGVASAAHKSQVFSKVG